MKRAVLVLCCLLAAVALPGRADAAKVPPQANAAKQGIAAAVKAGRIEPADASRYRGIVARAVRALPKVGGARYANLKGALDSVAAQHGRYTAPRALLLFSMLDENVRWFGAKGPPAPQSDTTGPDGTVYRYFPGHGLQFHPLANMAALNSDLAAGRADQAQALVDALRARAISSGGAVVWEYEFPFGGGRAPWTSGMAQAVAAQAFARASGKLEDPSLLTVARRAYEAIPGKLDMSLPVGRWVRLYSFSRMAVFNAQLQTAVSLDDYARLSGNEEAGARAAAMRAAVTKALPHVDTGYWTRYTIDGAEESRGYHDFVISVLARLRSQTKDDYWSDMAARFERYETEAPLFQLAPPQAAAKAGKKGEAKLKVTFWLSKRSWTVTRVGSSTRSLWLSHGWHTLTWTLPRSKPGVFPVSLQASPIAGPRASTGLLPLVVLGRAGKAAPARKLASAAASSGLVVGAAENAVVSADPGAAATQLGLATGAGLRAVRVAVPWNAGRTAPDPNALAAYTVTAQQAALAGVRLYFEVYPASPDAVPRDDAGRAQFAGYLRALALALPQVRDFVVGSQVNNSSFWPQDTGAAASYVALLAASYDALKGVDPLIQVIGGALSSQGTPGTYVLAMGRAYRTSGRAAPIMDAFAIQPSGSSSSEPPGAVHAKGPIGIGDYARLVANLKRAFGGGAQAGSTLPIVYDGYGVQSAIPPEKASLYTGSETDAVDETAQGQAYATALQLASCQPNVSALLFQHVVDERDLAGTQSGLYYADGTPKTSLATVGAAIAALGSDTACPGQPVEPAGPGAPPTVTPDASGQSAVVACSSDCYWTAVLVRESDGVPVRALKGKVAGGATATVEGPLAGLPAGDYHLTVYAAARHATGEVVQQDGARFSAG
ncbi:MAG TPA: D-glucuronyl C5-epimerase family protein [Gaiellaceae bacterium]|nr:D-glucuronyl C5-epimerase family protein [Gaiellaceae bacterium]